MKVPRSFWRYCFGGAHLWPWTGWILVLPSVVLVFLPHIVVLVTRLMRHMEGVLLHFGKGTWTKARLPGEAI